MMGGGERGVGCVMGISRGKRSVDVSFPGFFIGCGGSRGLRVFVVVPGPLCVETPRPDFRTPDVELGVFVFHQSGGFVESFVMRAVTMRLVRFRREGRVRNVVAVTCEFFWFWKEKS